MGGLQLHAHADVSPFLYLGNGWVDCTEIWYVITDPLASFFFAKAEGHAPLTVCMQRGPNSPLTTHQTSAQSVQAFSRYRKRARLQACTCACAHLPHPSPVKSILLLGL